MDFGAHLPLMDFGGNPYTLQHLAEYTDVAAQLGFSAVSTNDHMVFSVPWLDGPTALAAMIEHSGTMTLATTVALPVVRGPVPLAKTLAAIDRLSQGRLVPHHGQPGRGRPGHAGTDGSDDPPSGGDPAGTTSRGVGDLFAEKLTAFARAGVQRVFIWPVTDEVRQLELFCETVRPAVAS